MKRILNPIAVALLALLAACGTQQPEVPAIDLLAAPGDVVINEIMQNPSAVGDGAGEWFELFNPTAGAVDIDGWTVRDNDFDSHVISNGGPLLVPAGGYLVLGNNVDSATNGGAAVAYSYGSSFFLANGGDELVLLDDTLTEIDRVEWDGGPLFPDPNGASMALIDPALDNNSGANWCTATTPFGDGDLGTPGAANDCPSGGAGSTTLVINEIDYDQAGTDAAEFIELKNVSGAPLSLDGYALELVNGSGSGAAVYITIDLPAVSLAAGDYFVVCGDAANVANCDLDVSPDTNLIQNGAPDAVALRLGSTLVDTVSYEGDTAAPYTEGSGAGLEDDPGVSFASISRFPDGVDTDLNNVDLGQRCITPGGANSSAGSGCGPTLGPKFIHEVQGDGATSPISGATVIVEGVVVGDFQDGMGSDGDLNGFFLQEEDADADGDTNTSEGIFVFDGSNPSVDVKVGDLVEVTGTVAEFSTSGGASLETQLTNPVVIIKGTGDLPAATDVTLPLASADALEVVEGMRVRLPQSLTIVEYFNYDRFGEVVLATDRLFQPTAVFPPGPDADALAAENALSRITLDDGLTASNPEVTRHPNGDPFSLDNRFRGGDLVTDAVGVVGDTFGLYRLQPTGPASYTSVNDRPAAPDPVGGSLRVASFNVLNYFLTLDAGPDICGPDQDQDCRGADNAEEFIRQRAKILNALLGLDADVVGLIEMENTTGVEPLADIVAGLNSALGAGTYTYIDTGTIGGDAIKVGLIYKPAAALPFGDFAILDSSVDSRFDDNKNRPALAQSFLDRSGGGVVTVAVNHLKSKGSPCNDVGDPDAGDGQGNCNLTRAAAAQALAAWLATDPTASGQGDALIVGDLNAYDEEDPIAALLGAGYTDLIESFQGNEFAYSFVFDGQFGYLDHALANAPLVPQVTGTTEWHINADEPDLLDYDTSFKSDGQDAIYAPDAYRASDHDPVLVGLALDLDADAVIAALLAEVAGLKEDGSLNQGQARALTRHLQQAKLQIDRGRVNGARGVLGGFVSQVNDFVADGVLTAAQGASLTSKAEALLAGL